MSYFRDPEFQHRLVAFLCRDRMFLKECAHLLSPDDFKPTRGQGPELWILSEIALDYWRKYRDPVGPMLRSEVLDHAKKSALGAKQKEGLLTLARQIKKKGKMAGGDALLDKVIAYKKDRLKATSVTKLLDLMERGKLTDEKWLEICMRGVETFGVVTHQPVELLEGVDTRISRRLLKRARRYPFLMIDPLDELVKAIGKGHMGLWLGPYKSGKSLALLWTAIALMFQGYNTLYITLEDPVSEVEDRFDAAISGIPIGRLEDVPNRLRNRYDRFVRTVKAKVRLIDGTEGGVTVPRIEEIWERERAKGFYADSVIVDYDDEIQPVKKREERRFEFSDIYRDLRQFAARKKIILWTGAQANRRAEGKKRITGGMTAEDISKMRKVSMCIGIGRGDWGDNSRYLYVAAHKFDQQEVGCNIMQARRKGLFYDREATLKRRALEAAAKEKEKK